MTHDGEVSRRRLLVAAGLGACLTGMPTVAGAAPSGLDLSFANGGADVPTVAGLHIQFGDDAATEMVVSWHTLAPVRQPGVLLGLVDGQFLRTVDATQRSYVDAKSGRTVYAYHGRIGGLTPDTRYMYAALHDGAAPEFGLFRTAPQGRAPFTFTSFGDQGTPTVGRRFIPPAGVTLHAPVS